MQKSRFVFVLLLLSSCLPLSNPAPTQSLSGQVVWGTQAIADTVIELTRDNAASVVIARAVSTADGSFSLPDVPAGLYRIQATAPSQDFWVWRARGIEVEPDAPLQNLTIDLAKKLEITAPRDQATTDTLTPTLMWESFPGAVHYRVEVLEDTTGDLIIDEVVSQTQLTVREPLNKATPYLGVVSAVSSVGQELAYALVTFTADSSR